jgi:hypothetical protein
MPQTTHDYIADSLAKYRRLAPEFRRVFGRLLKPYWDHLTGFDVIAFDDFIKPGKKESTKDAVKRKYGDEGVQLVEQLIAVTNPRVIAPPTKEE